MKAALKDCKGSMWRRRVMHKYVFPSRFRSFQDKARRGKAWRGRGRGAVFVYAARPACGARSGRPVSHATLVFKRL